MTKPRFSSIIRIFKLLGHASFILLFLAVPFVFIGQTNNPIRNFNPLLTLNYWIYFVSFIGFFYSFTYYIIPCYLLTKKYWKFAGIMLLATIFFFLLKPFERIFQDILEIMRGRKIEAYDPLVIDFLTNFTFVMLTALGLSIQIVKQWRQSERRTLQAEADKANSELAFLKNQINPHFLFNTLNNIYSLSLTQSPKTSLSIMKLSNLMHYIADDANKNFISLEREAAYIRDYIDLQKLRLGMNMQVDFSVAGITPFKSIAPLILMSFVENTFKYGVTTREAAAITIRLFSDEKKITFFCQNKIFIKEHRVESTGIGLANTRHRLKLIYPGRHTLEIDDHNGLFTVNLTLLT